MIEPGTSTVTDPIDSDDGCPGCGTTTGVQPQPAPPTVQAWTCTACDTSWAITSTPVRPDPRWILQHIITLAEQAPELTDVELRARLHALAEACGAR